MPRHSTTLTRAAVVLILAMGAKRGSAQVRSRPQPRSPAAPSPITPTAGPPAPFHLDVTVRPDTAGIGEPFVVSIRVRAPRGAVVSFPLGPDSANAVDALDPRTVSTRAVDSGVVVTASYRLAAWDVGRQPITLTPLDIRIGDADRTVALGDLAVVVRPTAPSDSAGRIPKPARGLFPMSRPWWREWSVAATILLGALALWLAVRVWRHRSAAPGRPSDPLSLALAELSRLDRLGLIEAGERGRYVALVAEVVRTYVSRRFPEASVAHTSGEALEVVSGDPRVPGERLRRLLGQSDLVKFAHREVTHDQARGVAAEAREVIAEIDQRLRAAPPSPPATPPRPPGGRASGSATRPRDRRTPAGGPAA